MKNAEHFYNALLKLYPHSYQREFDAQMVQTFIDNYQDIQKTEGGAGLSFWLLVITDEIRNIVRQHMESLSDDNAFLRVTKSKVALSVLLLFPVYAVFYASLVKITMALPHPPVSGIGVLLALAALLLFPGILSIVASYMIANALINVCPKRKTRTV